MAVNQVHGLLLGGIEFEWLFQQQVIQIYSLGSDANQFGNTLFFDALKGCPGIKLEYLSLRCQWHFQQFVEQCPLFVHSGAAKYFLALL